MRSCIYVTDPTWLTSLERSGIRDGVNFWRKDQRELDLLPGDLFYFKPKGSMTVAGRGYFREQLLLPFEEVWLRFGAGNGVSTLAELRVRTQGALVDGRVGCLVLDRLQLLPGSSRPSLAPALFPPHIQNCKFFREGNLADIERSFATQEVVPALISAETEQAQKFDPQNIKTARATAIRSICVRRGQAAFREKLLAAYGGRCCVSGETMSIILEAAHIHPYLGTDTNDPTNGLLLRSDWHTLFDLGLWTIDELMVIRVSGQLDGSTYASYEGRRVYVPHAAQLKPSRSALKYHRERIFCAN
jgi:hypothetical protein